MFFYYIGIWEEEVDFTVLFLLLWDVTSCNWTCCTVRSKSGSLCPSWQAITKTPVALSQWFLWTPWSFSSFPSHLTAPPIYTAVTTSLCSAAIALLSHYLTCVRFPHQQTFQCHVPAYAHSINKRSCLMFLLSSFWHLKRNLYLPACVPSYLIKNSLESSCLPVSTFGVFPLANQLTILTECLNPAHKY